MAGGMGLTTSLWRGFDVIEHHESRLSERTIGQVRTILKLSIGLLLIGHGGLLAIAHMPVYAKHFGAIGLPPTQGFASAVGWFELALGAAVIARPWIPLVWFVFFWKLATESLWPVAGRAVDIFETIERWGDYGACIALLLILYRRDPSARRAGSADPTRARSP